MRKKPLLMRGLQKIAEHRGPLSCEKLLSFFNHKGPFLILSVISAFFCIPLSIPGLSTPFGLLVAWISVYTLIGKHDYPLPRWILKKKIPSKLGRKAARILLRVLRLLQPLIHPRLKWFTSSPITITLSLILAAILGLLLALPLPIPGTNLFTAVPLLLISLGSLEEDGVILSLGYLACLTCFSLFFALVFFEARFL